MLYYSSEHIFLIEEFDGPESKIKGTNYVINGLKDKGYLQSEHDGPSRHLTYCFNIFVMMQIFNFINARKIHDEFNTFSNISKSPLFIIIVIVIFILQIIILTFGNIAFRCRKWGLGPIGWAISFAFGIVGMIINFLLKLIPEDKICPKMGNKEDLPIRQRSKLRSLSLRSQISLRSKGQHR